MITDNLDFIIINDEKYIKHSSGCYLVRYSDVLDFYKDKRLNMRLVTLFSNDGQIANSEYMYQIIRDDVVQQYIAEHNPEYLI